MIIDANSVPQDERVETDLCIIGAGAAGIALGRAFRDTSLKVAILESGGYAFDHETQSLYQGSNVGLPYFPLHAARMRFLGGTTNHWAGWCHPFKTFDFETRDGIPYTGWPITKADLDPYYLDAANFLLVDNPEWSSTYWESVDSSDALHFASGRLENKVITINSSTRRHLGSIYRDEMTTAENVDTYLHANVTGIVPNESGREVTHVDVATLAGNRFAVNAKHFILAAGGIENPRILLLSNKHHVNGLGNQYDLVGRFFTEHPRFVAARFFPTSENIDLGFYSAHRVNGTQIKGHLILGREFVEREQLVDVQMRLNPAYLQTHIDALTAKSGTSLVHMLKSLANAEVPDQFAKHLSRVVFDIEHLPGYVYTKLIQDRMPVSHVNLITRMDSAPNPDSRLQLSATERDSLGQPRLELDWRLHAIDKHSAVRAAEVVGEELGRSGLGRLQMAFDENDAEWPADTAGGFHHTGTTRMSDDPKRGVVDRNCKVHGIANLYVAGSSVFPTAGSGSPTLTIVALALRLAEHLRSKVS